MLSVQHSLFRATALATSQLFLLSLALFITTVLLQVGLALPLTLRPSGAPAQCYEADVCTLSPKYVSQPVPLSSSYLAAYVTDLCHFNHSLVCNSLLPSNSQYPSQALALKTVQFFIISFSNLPCITAI